MKTRPNASAAGSPQEITCVECGFDYAAQRHRCPLCGNVSDGQKPAPPRKPSGQEPIRRSPAQHVIQPLSIEPGDEFRLAPATPRLPVDLPLFPLIEETIEVRKRETTWTMTACQVLLGVVAGAVGWGAFTFLPILTVPLTLVALLAIDEPVGLTTSAVVMAAIATVIALVTACTAMMATAPH